jgi:hypothetical protein
MVAVKVVDAPRNGMNNAAAHRLVIRVKVSGEDHGSERIKIHIGMTYYYLHSKGSMACFPGMSFQ